MRRKDSGTAILILLGIIAAPFVWLYERLGAVGFWSLFTAIVISWVFLRSRARDRHYLAVRNKAIQAVLGDPMPWREVQAIMREFGALNPSEAALFGRIKIFRESIDLALSSKKRETAESRMEVAKETYRYLLEDERQLTPDLKRAISAMFDQAQQEFATRLYINVAQGYIDKANTVKTLRTKQKYFDLARDTLTEGLEVPGNDKVALQQLLATIQDKSMVTG